MRFYESQYRERIGYDFYCDIASRTVEARRMKGWTQEQLADASGIKADRVARLEAVQARFYLDDVRKLSAALDVSTDWLVEAELDSQIGECLYLVSLERFPDFKFYQKATSKRMAFLRAHERASKVCRFLEPRDRAIVQLVGVPVTDKDLQREFRGPISKDADIVLPDES
ncbi:helix-turn-helix transcriptional regulator [Intestinimonas massiliensis]|uniref:Helix-turn-helix transcriptional regulator n=2 Tax=Intestinimonas massiliensis (ex Afouda et al. 2020) TaxID=1673721 RepID=A0AAW5JGZ7_9FIRM|nr:helix-turn-helix transcriptional regulator [Intestinimonas massiliensis (ex Afouda et al. 2020)]MCQ4769082.1 helix-turn-helix transcriptional regulator [Intestinimonas massiliensis (ex Afouda et al. 2020)]